MAHKLFSPLKAGALELQHRLVRECGPAKPAGNSRAGTVIEPDSGPWSQGGLVIFDPKVGLGLSDRFASRQAPTPEDARAWCRVAEAAHDDEQKIVLRLGGIMEAMPEPMDLSQRMEPERLIASCRFAAENALGMGFDGVELDGSAGTVTDLLLNPETNRRADRYGGPLIQRLNFLDELVEVLVRACGGDRVGARLAPFTMRCAAGEALATVTAALQILRDREVAYVHFTDVPAIGFERAMLQPLPVGADRLRSAYPGTLMASGAHTLASATTLIESRWADAICFKVWPPPREPILRRAGPVS
ncbi:MAG TPA: hypothetical protein VKQ29_08475 [Aliidongia sp.]|nr:hypothetical protein [Aliidongia sp.]